MAKRKSVLSPKPNSFSTKAEIVFVVFSVVKRESFEKALELVGWLRGLNCEDGLPLIFLVGNQIDRVNEQTRDSSVTAAEAESAAHQRGVKLFYTSGLYALPILLSILLSCR